MASFSGFHAADFAGLANTHWRSRESLAGVLCEALSTRFGVEIKSKALGRRAELHLFLAEHYDLDRGHHSARLSVHVEKSRPNNEDEGKGLLHFGFYVECPQRGDPSIGQHHHWRNFVDWFVNDDQTRARWLSTMATHDLELSELGQRSDEALGASALGARYQVRDGQLERRTPTGVWSSIADSELTGRLAAVRDGHPSVYADLNVFATIAQDKAIGLGPEVVEKMLDVLVGLFPLYEQVVSEDYVGVQSPAEDGRLIADETSAIDPELAAFEGELRRRMVNSRRRESRLRQVKVLAVLQETGRLVCEVPGCGFDFAEVYGPLGKRYIQVHHLNALADRAGPEPTTLADLVVVCANCHAMIHRGGQCRPLAELRSGSVTDQRQRSG